MTSDNLFMTRRLRTPTLALVAAAALGLTGCNSGSAPNDGGSASGVAVVGGEQLGDGVGAFGEPFFPDGAFDFVLRCWAATASRAPKCSASSFNDVAATTDQARAVSRLIMFQAARVSRASLPAVRDIPVVLMISAADKGSEDCTSQPSPPSPPSSAIYGVDIVARHARGQVLGGLCVVFSSRLHGKSTAPGTNLRTLRGPSQMRV